MQMQQPVALLNCDTFFLICYFFAFISLLYNVCDRNTLINSKKEIAERDKVQQNFKQLLQALQVPMKREEIVEVKTKPTLLGPKAVFYSVFIWLMSSFIQKMNLDSI